MFLNSNMPWISAFYIANIFCFIQKKISLLQRSAALLGPRVSLVVAALLPVAPVCFLEQPPQMHPEDCLGVLPLEVSVWGEGPWINGLMWGGGGSCTYDIVCNVPFLKFHLTFTFTSPNETRFNSQSFTSVAMKKYWRRDLGYHIRGSQLSKSFALLLVLSP